jgi:hypothetical protein
MVRIVGWVLFVVGLGLAIIAKGFPDWRYSLGGFVVASVGSLLLLTPWRKPRRD